MRLESVGSLVSPTVIFALLGQVILLRSDIFAYGECDIFVAQRQMLKLKTVLQTKYRFFHQRFRRKHITCLRHISLPERGISRTHSVHITVLDTMASTLKGIYFF